jgi:hypothetical protein
MAMMCPALELVFVYEARPERLLTANHRLQTRTIPNSGSIWLVFLNWGGP